MTTHDDATTWRDLADELTPEQAARFDRLEAAALHSIAQGSNHESVDDVARGFLAEARWTAQQNLNDAMVDIAR